MFSTIIKELGHALGLADLNPDELGALTLSIDGQHFTLQFFEGGEEIYIIHRLGALPVEKDEVLQTQAFLLHCNCFFRGVGSGVLGVEDNTIFYAARLSCTGLSGRELERFLRATVDTCARLREDMALTCSGPHEGVSDGGFLAAHLLRV